MSNYSNNPLIPGNETPHYMAEKSDNPLIPGSASGTKRVSSRMAACNKAIGTTRPMLSTPSAAQLAKINTFAKRPHTADELICGQLRLAHNAIDRDTERFSEEVLQGFNATIIRKTLLLNHDRDLNSAVGKFFDSVIEKLPLTQANAETGETLKMPVGNDVVWFLSPWFYVPRAALDSQNLGKLEGGIFDFCSIGFAAEKLTPIFDNTGKIAFHEYQGEGKALEGSLVWLGAQPGASIKNSGSKSADEHYQAPDSSINPLIP